MTKSYSQRGGYTFSEAMAVVFLALVLVGILLPFYRTGQQRKTRFTCQTNLQRVGYALAQYSQDYDQRLPPVKINAVTASRPPFARPFGWADAIQPYLRGTAFLHCPELSQRTSIDATQNGFTDYWFNARLATLPARDIVTPERIFWAGEGNDGHDLTHARYAQIALPDAWYFVDESPLRRHLEMANYLFADGHVKSLHVTDLGGERFAPEMKKP